MLLNSEEIRSFVAIELPEEVKNRLVRLRGGLERKEHAFVKWVEPGGIHLTLKFLGNISPELVTEITGAIKESSEGISPFRLELSGLGAFPNLRQPRVVWAGIYGDVDKLLRLQHNVDSALSSLGFAKEARPFTPHLTLARIKQGAPFTQLKNFGELVMSSNFEMGYSFKVKTVDLMRSQLTPKGAIYTRISVMELRAQNK